MKRVLILFIFILVTACDSQPLAQPEINKATPTHLPTATEEIVLQTSTPISSIQATPTPKFIKASPTPKPTVTAFPTVPVVTKTISSERPMLSLEITLDKTKLEPPVQEVIYLTVDRLNGSYSESISQIWRANVENIHQATSIITLTHRENAFPNGLILSPDNQYLVFGQIYNRRTHLMEVWLLNVNDGSLQTIDRDVTPQVNSQAFLWSADSKSIIYTKVSNDWRSSALYQYFLETKEAKLLFEQEGLINLVGWKFPFVYYLARDYTGLPYSLKSYDVNIGEIQNIVSVPGKNTSDYMRMSPNGEFALFNYVVVDLQTKTQIAELPYPNSLWLPDGQGLIGSSSNTIEVKKLNNQFAKELTREINLPLENIELINWSPDGQYLIYRNPEANLYHLLNLISNQVQVFETTEALKVGGWISQ